MMHDGNAGGWSTSGATQRSNSYCWGDHYTAWEMSVQGSCRVFSDSEIMYQIVNDAGCASGQHSLNQDGENYAAASPNGGGFGVYVGEGGVGPHHSDGYVLYPDGSCRAGDLDGDLYSPLVPEPFQYDIGFGNVDVYDCNDNDASVHKGATDFPCDGVDQDCVGGDFLGTDADGDGWTVESECNPFGAVDSDDNNPDANPGEGEIPYNQLDDDSDVTTWDDDFDDDHYCRYNDEIHALSEEQRDRALGGGYPRYCHRPTGAFSGIDVTTPSDCNDNNAAIPGDSLRNSYCEYGLIICFNSYVGMEGGTVDQSFCAGDQSTGSCDGIWVDVVSESDSYFASTWTGCYKFEYPDYSPTTDEGIALDMTHFCAQSHNAWEDQLSGYWSENWTGSYIDGRPTTDGCFDAIDNDCDGQVDMGDIDDCGGLDSDGDGAFEEPVGDDCDDDNGLIYPGASEFPNGEDHPDGIDNNCNGIVDEGLDADDDGVPDEQEDPGCAAELAPGNDTSAINPATGCLFVLIGWG